MISNCKLGVFDSGVGGFSVLKELRKKITVDMVYFGDCARAPYGNKEKEEIQNYIKEIIFLLKKQNVTHFVSACNSMSVMTTKKILEECGIVEGVYIDMLKAFNDYGIFPANARMVIIGTQATVNSGAYQDVLKKKKINSYDYFFKTLAGSIETGESEENMYKIIKPMIMFAKKVKATHILYGCTHYPLIDYLFKRCADDMNWKGSFVDPSLYVVEAVSVWGLKGGKNIDFQTSKKTKIFVQMSNDYL